MPILQKERHFTNGSISAPREQDISSYEERLRWGIWDRGFKPCKPKIKNEPTLDWGQWDHKPNTAPYTNWYRLQYTKIMRIPAKTT